MTNGRWISFKVGCVLLFGALAAWRYAEQTPRRQRWVVVQEPIRLEAGISTERAFTVDVACDYSLEVECRKTIPEETLSSTLKNELEVAYEIYENGLPIAKGKTDVSRGISTWKESIARRLGQFPGVPGRDYRLYLDVTRSLPQLATTDPIIRIEVVPMVYREAYGKAARLTFLAKGAGIIGLACILPLPFSFLFRRRRGPDDEVPGA